MKKTMLKATCLVVATLTLTLSACKKDEITQSKKVKPTPDGVTKNQVYNEGIFSNDGYSGGTDVIQGYYQFWGPTPGQQATTLYSIVNSPGSGGVTGCGATTSYYIYAYQNSAGTQYLEGNLGSTPLFDATTGNLFTRHIEEIEIHPQTLDVYALVVYGNSRRIYGINTVSGVATPVTISGNPVIFSNPLGYGYGGGSIAFVPDGSGGYEFVFSHESNQSAGVVSWHYSLLSTSLTAIPANNHVYTGIPGTFGSGINTTYGNGKLYFARHGSSNPLYSLSLTPSSNTVTSEGFSITNNNDFGYWKLY